MPHSIVLAISTFRVLYLLWFYNISWGDKTPTIFCQIKNSIYLKYLIKYLCSENIFKEVSR